MSDIFLSYATEDRPRAKMLADALAAHGWTVWWDRQIQAGKRFDKVIADALADARCIVVIWSAQSVNSDWVREEAEEGRTRDILVPVLIEEVRPPLGFGRIQAAQLVAWDGSHTSQSFQKLIADVASVIGPPTRASDTTSTLTGPEPVAVLREVAYPSRGQTSASTTGRKAGTRRFPQLRWSFSTITALVLLCIVASFIALYQTGVFDTKIQSRLTVITNNASNTLLADRLRRFGAEVSLLSPDRLGELPSTRPDVVIVADDTKSMWPTMSKSSLAALFEDHKVLGIGEGGSTLFAMLDLELAHVMHSRQIQISVATPELLHSPFTIAAPDNVVEVSRTSEADVVGVYDEGSPSVGGFEGIGRWTDHDHHWPIARQGNYALWGFSVPASGLTDSGLKLLANLLVYHQTHASVPLSKARKKLSYVTPGPISDRLNAQFSGHRWPFQVRNKGRIRAELSWQPADTELALILNGPGQTGYFRRADGPSPLSLEFDVEEDRLSKGTDWIISVKAFGNLEARSIDYRLTLVFPQQ